LFRGRRGASVHSLTEGHAAGVSHHLVRRLTADASLARHVRHIEAVLIAPLEQFAASVRCFDGEVFAAFQVGLA
jgi:hypothetical protein